MLCQQNVKTMYFRTLNPRLFNLRQWFEFRFFSVVICKCCKFSPSLLGSCTGEFWMELKNQIQGVCWTTVNNLTLRVYLFLRQFFKTEWKKNSVDFLYWNNQQHSGPPKKTQLNQAVRPYSFNVVKRRGFWFFTEFLKMNFSSSLMLKNFSSHLTWKLTWTSFHKWSPLFQWTWTRLNL